MVLESLGMTQEQGAGTEKRGRSFQRSRLAQSTYGAKPGKCHASASVYPGQVGVWQDREPQGDARSQRTPSSGSCSRADKEVVVSERGLELVELSRQLN